MARKTTKAAATASPDAALDRAEIAVKQGDKSSTLSALLEGWREVPDPVLAAAIEALTIDLNRGRVLYPPDASREERILAWDQLARSPDDADIGLLAGTLMEGVRAGDTSDRIDRLGAMKPDPRIAAAYQRMIAMPPWTASSNGRIWTTMLDQATGTHADPRTASLIRSVEAKYLDIFGRSVMGEKIQRAIGRAAKTLEDAFSKRSAALDDAPRARLDAVVEAWKLRPVTGAASLPRPLTAAPVLPPSQGGTLDSADAFLAHIAEAPDEDSRIEAFAAWLARKGDPRAEFMDIQLRRHRGQRVSGADEKREMALLKKYQKEWLGPIAGAVPGSPQGFERGVLTGCIIALKGKHSALAVGHPGWATVRKVTSDWKKDVWFLVGDPIFRSLRDIDTVHEELFLRLCHDTVQRPIRAIATSYGPRPSVLGDDFSAPALPELRDLSIQAGGYFYYDGKYREDPEATPESYLPFLSSPLVARLEILRITGGCDVPEWLHMLERSMPQRLNIPVEVGTFTVARAPGGRHSQLALRIDTGELYQTSNDLESLSPGRFTRLEVSYEGALDSRDQKESSTRLRAQLARFRKAVVEVIAPRFDP